MSEITGEPRKELPFGLLAELTYRCPLHCPYCSNPLNLYAYRHELSLDEWRRVLAEASGLGVMQLHLSGGEPLLRRDLEEIIIQASNLGLYSNLITSALSLTEDKLKRLKKAGLNHIQISLQAPEAELSDRIAGTTSYHRKIRAAKLVKEFGFPLTLNIVLHRQNIDQIEAMLELAEELQADRLELANTQYYGWGLKNRPALLPTHDQIQQAERTVRAALERLTNKMKIIYVLPDYYNLYPKPCSGGWARRQLTVAPNGDVLPCPAAGQITGLPVENVRQRSLDWIWSDSPMFNHFRGFDWMEEPCRSCSRKTVDFGGCRCQAFQLTGNAAAADPVCPLSRDHSIVANAVEAVNRQDADPVATDFVYRTFSSPRI